MNTIDKISKAYADQREYRAKELAKETGCFIEEAYVLIEAQTEQQRITGVKYPFVC